MRTGTPQTGDVALLRVGLNTGEVVVRSIRKDDLHTDYVPVGHSTNLAARMESWPRQAPFWSREHSQAHRRLLRVQSVWDKPRSKA